MNNTYLIRLPNGMSCECFADAELILKAGDYAILKRDFSLEYVQIIRRTAEDAPTETTSLLPQIQRIATVMDRATATENEAHAKSAYRTACTMVEKMGLPMKLLNASYSFDRKLVTIQFTADGRVDFRELVKELSHALGTRLDLRQIGVRDEAKMLGGLGACGRPLCCSTFLPDFAQVSIKMAKDQNLSLNSTKISGLCGRLMCCLRYESEVYAEEIRLTPSNDTTVKTADGIGTVISSNPLAGTVRVLLKDSPDTPPKQYHRSEVVVIGKEKRGNSDSKAEKSEKSN